VVSQVDLKQGDAFSVSIDRADGAKCERCWKYTTDVGSNADFPTICAACARAVNGEA
jgi:isoleucyl-tRNA synthetase